MIVNILILILFQLSYINIARKYKILDRPNERSIHLEDTIRGGGFLFIIAIILQYQHFHVYYLISILIIAFVFFTDDIRGVNLLLKLITQVFVSILLIQTLPNLNLTIGFVLFFYVLAGLNFFTFMDGINALLGLYSLTALITLELINLYVFKFDQTSVLIIIIVGVLIFLYFNFRHKAVVFAGDVGSISIGFIILGFIIKLIYLTSDYYYFLLTFFFFLDTSNTIFWRTINNEKITVAHKKHLFQLLYQNGYNAKYISISYATLQIILNIIIVTTSQYKYRFVLISFIVVISIVSSFIIRFKIQKNLMPKSS